MMGRCERIMRVMNYKSRLKLLFVLPVCWIIDYNVVCGLTRFQWCCIGLWSNPVSETPQTSSWCAVRWGSRITLIEPVRCSCGRANKIRLYSVACFTWSDCVRTGNINLLIWIRFQMQCVNGCFNYDENSFFFSSATCLYLDNLW